MTVYFALAVKSGRIKIGCARADVPRRLRQLERRCGERLVVLATTFGGRRCEAWWHRRHRASGDRHEFSGRLNEWFAPSPELVGDIVELIGGQS